MIALSWGIRNLDTASPWAAEHHVPKQPQQVHLQVCGDSWLISISSHEVSLRKMKISRYVCCNTATKSW
jgi:hypothetical protein